MSSVFLGMTVIHRRNEKQILCKILARVFVCFDGPSRAINNSGGSRRGARLPSYYWTKLRPEEKFFPDHPPPPYLRVWMTSPPFYLRVWIRHWINSFLRDNCRKFPTGEICSQSENSIYFSLPTCESRHILLSLWRLGGVLIHFFTDVYNFSLCYLFFTSPVYHYTRFWNFLWELSVKLVVCSLDSLSCRIISRNWTKSGADVFQVYSIFFSRDHPRLILGWKGYFMSLFFHWSRGCC